MTTNPRVYLRSQKCWDIRQKAPDARRMSAALLGGMQANATQQMGLFGRIEQRWGSFQIHPREGESKHPPRPSGPAERQTVKGWNNGKRNQRFQRFQRFHGTPRKARFQRNQRNHDSTAPQRNHESNETHENNEMPLLRAFRFFRCVWRNRDFVATVGARQKARRVVYW